MINLFLKIKQINDEEVLIDANFDIEDCPNGTELELEAANLLLDRIDKWILEMNTADAKLLAKDICRKIGKNK